MTYKIPPFFKISLPWPDRALSPNTNIHWAKKKDHKKQARADGYLTCQEQKPFRLNLDAEKLISVRIFYPPDRRHYDTDNLGASLKNYQDGIFDWLSNTTDVAYDDRMVEVIVNILAPVMKYTRVDYMLFPESRSFWIKKMPTLRLMALIEEELD